MERRPPHPLTRLAACLAIGLACVTLLTAGSALFEALGVIATGELSEQAYSIGLEPGDGGAASAATAVVLLPVGICEAVFALGLAGRRERSRINALVVFGVVALVLIAFSLVGLTADPPGRNAGLGMLLGLGHLTVAVLAVAPDVAHDIDLAEMDRERRRGGQDRKLAPRMD
jgi:hypothetical protein